MYWENEFDSGDQEILGEIKCEYACNCFERILCFPVEEKEG